jgi:cation transport ATPase
MGLAAAPDSVAHPALRDPGRFVVLDDPVIAARLIDVNTGRLARVTLSVPRMHCASCVWLLEQLWRLDPGVVRAGVDLLRRTVRIEFELAMSVAPAWVPISVRNRSSRLRPWLLAATAGLLIARGLWHHNLPHASARRLARGARRRPLSRQRRALW